MLDSLSSQMNTTALMPASIEVSQSPSSHMLSLKNTSSTGETDRLTEKTESLTDKISKENTSEEKESTKDDQDLSLSLDDQFSMVSEFSKSLHNELEFSTDDDSGRTIVKVVNKETEEIIRQIPSDEFLRMSNSMDEVKSALFSSQA